MSTFETSATVQEHGQILVAGVPFAPGTEVEVTISPIKNGAGSAAEEAAARAERLLAALNNAHNIEPIGAFNRGDVYDRDVLR